MRRWMGIVFAVLATGCGIKGAPKPPVQVVQPPGAPTAAQQTETPPRPERDETGVERGPFNAAAVDAGTPAPRPVQVDGGSPLIPDGGAPVPDAPGPK